MASNWAVYLICLLRCKCSWNHHRSSQKVIGKGEPRKAGDLFWCGTGHRFHEAIENQDHQYFGGCTLFNLEYRNTLEMHDFTTVNSLCSKMGHLYFTWFHHVFLGTAFQFCPVPILPQILIISFPTKIAIHLGNTQAAFSLCTIFWQSPLTVFLWK